MTTNRFTLWASFFALLSTATTASAYIPPSYFVVRQIAKKHSDLSGVTLKSHVTFLDGHNPKSAPLTETISISSQDKVSVSLKNAEGQLVYSGSRTLTSEGRGLSPMLAVTLSGNGAAIFTSLKNLGIPVKTESQVYSEKDPNREHLPYRPEEAVSLGLADNRAVIILNGDGGRTLSAPQLWVEKSSFLPARFLFKSSSSSDTLDASFNGYSVYESSFVPRRIEIKRGDSLWCRIDLVEVTKGALATAANAGVTDQAGGLRDDIETYTQWIR